MRRFTQQTRYPLAERPVVMLDCGSASVVGGAISELTDRSGNGRNFTQGTASLRPAYNATDSDFKGWPSASPDGVDDYLGPLTINAAAAGLSVAAVFKTGSDIATDQRVFGVRVAATADNPLFQIASTLNTTISSPAGTYTNKLTTISTSTTYRAIATYNIAASGTGKLPFASVNGVETVAYAATAATAGTVSGSGAYAVMATDLGGLPLKGKLAAVIMGPSTWSASKVARVDEYLRAKYQRAA